MLALLNGEQFRRYTVPGLNIMPKREKSDHCDGAGQML